MIRVKIDLRRQYILFTDYTSNKDNQVLFGKSRYLPRDAAVRAKQANFDSRLLSLGYLDLSGYGPTKGELLRQLNEHGDSLEALIALEC